MPEINKRDYLAGLEREVENDYQQNRNYQAYLKGLFKLAVFYVRWKIKG